MDDKGELSNPAIPSIYNGPLLVQLLERYENRFKAPIRPWLAIVAVLAAVDGVLWTITPSLAGADAYALLFNLAPPVVWGAMLLIGSALCFTALLRPLHDNWSFLAAVVGLGIYAMIAGFVGTSIAVLTIQGSAAALTGATKWWLPALLTARVLRSPRELHAAITEDS